jgi:hypothetical protein
MQAIITPLLALLQKLAPGATAEIIAEVISILTALIPILIQEYKDLLPIVQNVITVLQQSDDITDAQWDALDAMSAQYDAEFTAALNAAEAQDASSKPAVGKNG